MNRFRCTIASGGEGLTITVTCDSALAGATITATDGTTTLTKTCPSSSPYEVVFNLPNGGTWTISSGNDSVTVYFGDSVDLHHIPTGSSATPINDIQTWLHCANIWDKSYTTISQVLADGTTVTALIASNNAADYMARSTTWASSVVANSSAMTKIGANNYCADKLLANSTWRNAICNSTYFESVLNVKVPTMTGYTTPSGEAFSSGEEGTRYAWMPFDGQSLSISNAWLPNHATHSYIGYKFTKDVKIYKVKFKHYTNGGSQTDLNITVQSGANKANWGNIGTGVATVKVNTQSETSFICDGSKKGNSIRLYDAQGVYWFTSGGFAFIMGEAQFYGRE